MVAMFSIAMMTFVSCEKEKDKDNDGGADTPPAVPEEYSVCCYSGISGVDNFLFYDQMSITYLDAEGKTIEQTVTSLPVKIIVEPVKPPFTTQFTLNVKLKDKESIQTDKTSFRICSPRLHTSVKPLGTSHNDISFTVVTIPNLDQAYEQLSKMISKYNGSSVSDTIR